jgi:hypothetical protein
MNENELAAIVDSLSEHREEGATLVEAACKISDQNPNLSPIELAQALVAMHSVVDAQTLVAFGEHAARPQAMITADPLAAPIEIAGALKATGIDLNTLAHTMVAPGVYPWLTAYQLGTVLMAPSVFPNTTKAEMRGALQAANFSMADIDAALAKLFPPPPDPGGVIHYELRAGQPLPSVWQTTPNPQGPAVTVGDNLLHYEVSGQPGFNQWLTVSATTSLATAKGCLVVFNVRANTIQGEEVKFTVAGEPILRFTNGGQSVKWQRWDNWFYDLADSSIRPDGRWHQIILVLTPQALALFEDGKLLFTWARPIGDAINPRFDMQVLTPGSNLSFDVGDIYAVPSAMAKDNSTQWDYVFLKDTPPPANQIQFTTDGGMGISYEDGYARVGAWPLRRINSWSHLEFPRNSPAASVFMYPLRVNQSDGYETKITLPGDNILRLLGNGADSNWQLFDSGGNFQALSPSGIRPGQPDFTIVALVTSSQSITLFENGSFKYTRPYPSPVSQWNAKVDIQHYDLNNVSIDFGGIRTIPATKP